MTLFGVLVLTPDALLFRLADTDLWTIAFWRGSLMPIGLLILLATYYRGRMLGVIMGIGRAGIVVALMTTCSNLAFSAALTYTTAAKTLIMLACAPIFTALFSRLFLKERLNRANILTIAASFIGVCIVVSDHAAHGAASGSFAGDMAALLSAISMAAIFTYVRRHKEVNMLPACALGWLSMGLLALPFAQPLSLDFTQMSAVLIMGLVVLPVSFGLIMIGPRYIPAPEVSLLMLLETVLGPLWVWLVIREQPSVNTLIGGSVVIISIAGYSAWRLVNARKSVLAVTRPGI